MGVASRRRRRRSGVDYGRRIGSEGRDVTVGRQFGGAGRTATVGRRGLASDRSGAGPPLSSSHHGREAATSGTAQRRPCRMAQSRTR